METRFKELSNEWFNAGGNCMVDITTVYDKQDKKLLYMMVGCDEMTLATYNYVQEEVIDGTDADDFIVYTLAVEEFSTDSSFSDGMKHMPNEYFGLFNHGMLSYIKNSYKYDRQLTRTTVEGLPLELRRMVTDEYVAWLNDNCQLVTTDGNKIIVDERYEESYFDINARTAVEFKQLLEKMREDADADNAHLEEFYDERIHLIIKGKVFTLEMCAAVWNGLVDYADYIISEQ